jgi:hypothetical protein
MPVDSTSFVFIISLAAVVNGLGIVRWLTGFTEFMRRRPSLQISHYWVFTLSAAFQFLLHIVFWWSLWNIRGTATINFLSYLYLLSGPIFLFVGTAMLSPDFEGDEIDLKAHYFQVRPIYSSILALAWAWALFTSPVLRGEFAPHSPVFAAFLLIAIVRRATANPLVHSIAAAANWIMLAVFVGIYQMQLGGALQGGG